MTVTPYPKFKEGGLREGATVSCSVKILWRSYSIDFKTLRHPGLEFGLMYWLLCISKCPHTRTAWKQRLTFWMKTSKVSLGLSGMIQKGSLPPKHRPLGTIGVRIKIGKINFWTQTRGFVRKITWNNAWAYIGHITILLTGGIYALSFYGGFITDSCAWGKSAIFFQ